MKQQTLSDYLTERSKEICLDNHCTEDEHNCESYAYITKDGKLMDICCSDYFQGCPEPHACIPLPWHGTQEELNDAIADSVAEMED